MQLNRNRSRMYKHNNYIKYKFQLYIAKCGLLSCQQMFLNAIGLTMNLITTQQCMKFQEASHTTKFNIELYDRSNH